MSFDAYAERLFAGKWIAGPGIEDAVRVSRKFNKNGMRTIINYLGEEYKDAESVEQSVRICLALIAEVKRRGLRADVTVKPTQIGMLIGKSVFKRNYKMLIDCAKRNGVFLWFDMEEAWSVSGTIEMYNAFVHSGNTGICIQSYLKRSLGDVKKLAKKNAIIRLVKGAYNTPDGGGYKNREDTTKNYMEMMEYMFAHCKRFTIGTHDSKVVTAALKLNKKYKRDVTYAMLNGIRNNYALRLARSGEKVSIYVPFGEAWIPYSYRRLKELSNLKLIIRSMFGG